MPQVYGIRGKPLRLLPVSPRGAFGTSLSEGRRLAAKAEAEGRLDDASAIDAEASAFRWRAFRGKQMRLMTFERTCPDFMRTRHA